MQSICVSFIDVGKGDCILLQAGASAALIDTGYKNTAQHVLSHLRERGVGRLEFVIITHYDRDHVGGLRAIGEALPIGTVLLPPYEGADKNYQTPMSAIADLGLATQRVNGDMSFDFGGALFSIHPSSVEFVPGAQGTEGNDNDLSLVASLTYGNDSFLFTGDLEKDGLEDFLGSACGHYDVLKVPCHGRKCSFTDELFEEVRPRIAVITDSEEDHADGKTLKLLDQLGTDVYRTSTSGTIVIESNGSGNYTVS